MSDDVFRLVITIAVVLACLAFVVQAGMAIGMFRVARQIQEKLAPLAARGVAVADSVGPVIDKIGTVIEKTGPLVEQMGPVIKKAGSEVDRATEILTTAQKMLEEARPHVIEVSKQAAEVSKQAADVCKNVAAITRTGRQQVERISSLVGDASDRARERLDQLDHSVTNTVEQMEHAGDSVKRAVLRPVKEVNGLAAGISAAVSTLVHGSGRPSVDHATQDEEMFI